MSWFLGGGGVDEPNFSRMADLGQFNIDGCYYFALHWPMGDEWKLAMWKQCVSPFWVEWFGLPDGAIPINHYGQEKPEEKKPSLAWPSLFEWRQQYFTAERFNGLTSGRNEALLSGLESDNWWFAVGTTRLFNGKIPAKHGTIEGQ